MLKICWYSAIALGCIDAIIMVLVIPFHIAYNILSSQQYFGLWIFLAGSLFVLLFYAFGLLTWVLLKSTEIKDINVEKKNN